MKLVNFASNSLYQPIVQDIDLICRDNRVDSTHGLGHALKIATETQKALFEQSTLSVDDPIFEEIVCAALLHDIDDHKYFKSNGCQNAKKVLSNIKMGQKRIENIILMIDLVSFSKNGNAIDEKYPSLYYLPRYVDRSQAIGIQGLYRTYLYNKVRGFEHVFDGETPRPQSVEQVYKISEGRDIAYMKNGFSQSAVDHFFDKLVHIRLPAYMQNVYLIELYQRKHNEMVEFILKHAKDGYQRFEEDLLREYEVNGRKWENLQ